MRRFILVTDTQSEPAGVKTHSGIKKLKRGVGIVDFMSEYLEQFAGQKEIYARGETQVAFAREDNKSIQWAFTEFAEDELIRAVSNLTREELLRDLKELLPLKAAL